MSDPYVYTPPANEPPPYPYYSPYLPPYSLCILPTTFSSSSLPPMSPYLEPTICLQTSAWLCDEIHCRPLSRRSSWHAGISPSPYIWQTELPYRSRRDSSSNFWENISQCLPWAQGSHHIDIHPLLDSDAPYSGFYFDLSCPTFSLIPRTRSTMISQELSQFATNPPITQMRITHHSIPQWPIDLKLQCYDYHMYGGWLPHLSVGDVLYQIHKSLHQLTTHSDWHCLSGSKRVKVTRAWYRRCESMSLVNAYEGVRRVDYLKEKHMFAGLVKAHDEEGFSCWKLITKEPF